MRIKNLWSGLWKSFKSELEASSLMVSLSIILKGIKVCARCLSKIVSKTLKRKS